MAQFNDQDDDLFNSDDFSVEPEGGEDEPQGKAPKGNRTFTTVLAVLGGLLMLIIVALVLVWVFVQGPRRAAQDSDAAQINAQNTIQAAAATTQAALSFALAETETPAAALPTETPLPSPTLVVVFASDTPTPEPTEDAAKAALAAADEGVDDPSAARTATVAALLTQAAQGYGAGTLAAAGSPTALPTTGFADEVGLPGLLGVAVLMVGIIFLARRLRSNG